MNWRREQQGNGLGIISRMPHSGRGTKPSSDQKIDVYRSNDSVRDHAYFTPGAAKKNANPLDILTHKTINFIQDVVPGYTYFTPGAAKKKKMQTPIILNEYAINYSGKKMADALQEAPFFPSCKTTDQRQHE